MELCRLDIADYKEKALQVRYVTSYIYEAISKQGDDCFGVMFERTKLTEPLACGFDDVWGSEWLENPELFAVREAGQVIALMEICMESWTQRLRISNIYVTPTYRGRGCATLLLQHVKELAKERRIRCIVLETQSCNDPAIQCYLRNGFVFLGCDLSFKSNQDIENHAVRIEMGYYL